MESVIGGLIRHLLTAAGGGLLAQGAMTSGDIEIVTGAIIALGGVAWSVFSKRKSK